MTIIGFNFTKVSAEKKQTKAQGKINVNRSANPTGVEEVTLGSGQRALKYTFEFSVDYKPDIADVHFEGNITQLVDDETVDEVLEQWEEKKSLPPKVLEAVMNAILNRCHVEALLMAKELNIPPPFNLPKVKVREKDDE